MIDQIKKEAYFSHLEERTDLIKVNFIRDDPSSFSQLVWLY